jgi:putative redox protein
MATSLVTYLGELRTSAVHLASGNKIITDAPVDNNGKGEAFSPTDLVATSFASCMLTIMGIGAKSRGFSMNGTTVEVTKIMGTDPRRIIEIIATFTFPPNQYTEKQKDFFKHVADTCPVAKSIHPEIKQTVTFNF